MRTQKKLVFTFIFLISSLFCFSQKEGRSYGGDYKFNPENVPCISEAEKMKIWDEIIKNEKQLKEEGKLLKKTSKLIQSFSWPVRKAAGIEFFDVWAISNYLDHDGTSPNNLQDYNCGTRTYDTNSGYNHQGTDIYSWPFTWYQFQNNFTEVIAAASGTIIVKTDGNFDMSCDFNNDQWNAIYIRHNDGSTTWYGHLKTGTLTSKNVGDTVTAGEYLGVVGSSGNSTGPHLHFEVYDNNNNLVDPYSGPCNNITSWWQDQKDYYEPNINALLTHNAAPNFNTCPETETVNLSAEFLPNQDVYLASYFRDQLSGTTANYKLYKPNGTLFSSWTRNFSNTYTSSYWYWTFNTLSDLGSWKFECSYQGKTEIKLFDIVTVLNIDESRFEKITIAPNPFNNTIKLLGDNFNKEDYKLIVYNNLGQEVFLKDQFLNEMNLDFLVKGVYFLKVIAKDNNSFKTFPIIKK